MELNLLSQIRKSELRLAPFPHFIIRNAIEKSTYEYLDSSFPVLNGLNEAELQHLVNDRGHTFRLLSRSFNHISSLDPMWHKFSEISTSSDFFDAVVNFFFAEAIDRFYPGLRKKLVKFPKSCRSGDISLDSKKCLTDFQLVLNQPVADAHSSRSAHLDNPQQLYALLYYLRPSSDSSVGAGLNLFNPLKSAYQTPHGRNRSISSRHLDLKFTLPYESNTAILFLNTPLSYHSVQPIYGQHLTRRSVNIIGELPPGSSLFSVP